MQKRRVEQAFSDYADTVLRAVWHLTCQMHAAEDCTQEAFLRLLAEPDSMTDDHILPWLLRTALNLAKDFLKSAEHSRTLPLDEENSPQTQPFSESNEPDLLAMIQTLPKEVRVPMCLHFVEGYTIDETAELLHTPRSTVASRIRRARQKLKELFRKEDTAR